jgi:redox-sensitive bicupin YhaK (pirin superfamily)
MISIRKSDARGQGDRGWLKSHFTFSFADYHDPAFTGFRALKVMNEDRISPGKGFGPHAHRDMEIITFVLDGRLAHRDSMSGPHTVGPNEIQTMSAGTGVVHSEFNASDSEPVHLMQIWIEPASEDLPPSYQQVAIPPEQKRGRLHLLAGPAAGAPSSVDPGQAAAPATTINQNARLYVADLGAGETVNQALGPDRHAWVQVMRGQASVNGQRLEEGDGAAVSGERQLSVTGDGSSGGEILLFDLP